MNDQAKVLRSARSAPVRFPAGDRLIEGGAVVIGSGKGGVGKSLVSIALATALAEAGQRTLLVDADYNLGNLHVLLGVRPAIEVETLLGSNVDPASLVVPVRDNLWLMPAASGAEAMQRLSAHDRARLHRKVVQLYPAYDAVVVDAAGGLDSALRVVAMQATRLLVVSTPEPTALTSAYALVKMVHGRLPLLPIDFLVNRVFEPGETELAAERMREACSRFLGRTVRCLGGIPDDPAQRSLLAHPERLVTPGLGGAAQHKLHEILNDTLVPLLMARPGQEES